MIEPFGQTRMGFDVRCVSLHNGLLSVRILTLGAILQDLRLGTQKLCLGSAKLAAYDDGPMQYFGAVIGPVAGRIAGASGQIGGATLHLEANEGPNSLHSGAAGLHRKIWDIDTFDTSSVRLVTRAAHGEGGLPGNRLFAVRYALEGQSLCLTLEAQTDATSWITLTQHSYWHLGGPPGIDGHALRVEAQDYLPIGDGTLPVGSPEPVAGTRFDFRNARDLNPDDRLDHCFCLARQAGRLVPCALLRHPSGMTMRVATQAPGLQIHTADGVHVPSTFLSNRADIQGRAGLALEPQDWPNAPHHNSYPSIEVNPGTTWLRTTTYSFAVDTATESGATPTDVRKGGAGG